MAGLEDLYREIILDHYRNPRNRGELEVPPAVQAVGFNPLCGDEVVVYVDVQDGVITDVSTGGQGCSISQSSASMMSTAIKGRSVAEVRRLVRAFKHMMSIHGTGIGGTGDDLDDDGDSGNGAGDPQPTRACWPFPASVPPSSPPTATRLRTSWLATSSGGRSTVRRRSRRGPAPACSTTGWRT